MRRILYCVGLLIACDPNYVGFQVDATIIDPTADAGPRDDYPQGPYGAAEGDTIANMVFQGYWNAEPGEGLVSASGYEEVSLSRIRALRSLGYQYLLLNVSGEWCVPCQQEARILPGKFSAWAQRGGYVLGIIVEDKRFRVATKETLDVWVDLFQMNYTMVHDPQAFVRDQIAPAAMPTNLMIELETMRVLRRSVGEDPSFFDFFEQTLGP